jgi:hypothetical protein
VLGNRFTLIAKGPAILDGLSDTSRKALRALDAAVVHCDAGAGGITDAEGIYARFLDRLGCEAMLVRPDFNLVGGARTPDELNRLVDVMRVHLEATAVAA